MGITALLSGVLPTGSAPWLVAHAAPAPGHPARATHWAPTIWSADDATNVPCPEDHAHGRSHREALRVGVLVIDSPRPAVRWAAVHRDWVRAGIAIVGLADPSADEG
jgi:hypothetical protein